MMMLTDVAAALRLLTRLPLPGGETGSANGSAAAAAWFPVAGLTVGLVTAAAYAAAGLVWPPAVAAWAAIAAEMAITGALHPDGLADVADSMGGHTPARRLEIMRDPRLGSFGAVALLLTLGGRWALLSAAGAPAMALVVAHTASRWPPSWALARYPSARPGLAAAIGRAGWRHVATAAVVAVAVCTVAGGARGLAAAAAAAATGMLSAAWMARRLGGGVTGDVCGATAELGLLAALAVMAAP